jgi:hypothetical protein
MALDVYFREDIGGILRALYVANHTATAWMMRTAEKPVEPWAEAAGPEQPGPGARPSPDGVEWLEGYRQGYQTALISVALAFGIQLGQVDLASAAHEIGANAVPEGPHDYGRLPWSVPASADHDF